MTETLVFPELIAAAPRGALTTTDLTTVALSRFGDWRPQAAALVAKFTGVMFDATTRQGYAALIEAIAEVRAPRYAAQNVSEKSKSELAGVSKAIGAELAEVKKALQDVEAHLVKQKDAQDARVAEQKAAAAAAETARQAKHLDNIRRIRGYIEQAVGKAAAQIAGAAALVAAIEVSAAVWEEFADQARAARDDVVVALQRASEAAQQREDEAAALDARCAELERVAAEQAAEGARLQALAQALQTREPVASNCETAEPAAKGMEPVAPPSDAVAEDVAQLAKVFAENAAAAATQQAGIELQALRLALDLTEYAAAPFMGRFPSHPKPAGDWWAGLRQRIEVLQPMLHTALSLEQPA